MYAEVSSYNLNSKLNLLSLDIMLVKYKQITGFKVNSVLIFCWVCFLAYEELADTLEMHFVTNLL